MTPPPDLVGFLLAPAAAWAAVVAMLVSWWWTDRLYARRSAAVVEVLLARRELDARQIRVELRERGFRIGMLPTYTLLHNMELEGILVTRVGDATAVRGWRPRVFYRLSEGA